MEGPFFFLGCSINSSFHLRRYLEMDVGLRICIPRRWLLWEKDNLLFNEERRVGWPTLHVRALKSCLGNLVREGATWIWCNATGYHVTCVCSVAGIPDANFRSLEISILACRRAGTSVSVLPHLHIPLFSCKILQIRIICYFGFEESQNTHESISICKFIYGTKC